MEKLQVLVAHEHPLLGRAIERVLTAQGLRAHSVTSGDALADALRSDAWDGLLIDVSLPGPPLFELVELAKTGLPIAVPAVILITAAFRRSSYRRRAQQLYGADDQVELSQLGEVLTTKLWRLLGHDPSNVVGLVEAEALRYAIQDEAATATATQGPTTLESLAELLVADLILHSGEKLSDIDSPAAARVALTPDLDTVRELYHAVIVPDSESDPVGAAFERLLCGPGDASA